jgi:integrase/recombinase XerD
MFKRKGRKSWYMRVHRGGREHWVSLGADYTAAVKKARDIRSGVVSVLTGRVTVGQAGERWLETYIQTQRGETSRRTAGQRVRDYLDPFMGHMLIERVTGEDVRAYRLWLERKTKLSVTSIWHLLSDCRCLLRWCEDSGLVERSPFPRRVMPRLQERPPDRLTDEQAALIAALPEPHGFVCRLALCTGLRWGELCRAQAADVKRLRVSGSVEDQWFVEVANTKSKRVRRVPLTPDLLREVRGRVGRLAPYAAGSPGSFAERVRRRSGVEGFHVHQMRHTFACQWLERGGSLAALQQILGHASIVTTQRYAKLTDEAVMREAKRLGERSC